jgi:Phage gp6-like head-tail connector protein
MQFRIKTGQSLTEPVSLTDLKTYLGYNYTDQDAYFTSLITSVREFVENYTSLSCIAKVYEVVFEHGDDTGDRGWFALPIAPVNSISICQINGSDTTYQQRGLTEVEIYPNIGSILQKIDENILFGWLTLNVTYLTDVSDHIAILKDCILEICANSFTDKVGLSTIGKGVKRKLDAIKIPSL